MRINNSTSNSKKGMEQVFDLLRMVAHVIKSAEERGAEILGFFKESIVCNVLARVIPDTLGRIQFWPVGWKLEDFHVATVRFEPIVGFLLFVIRRVVLNQVDPVAAAIESRHDHLLQKCQIGFPLEIILLMKVDETGIVQTDGAENLLCMALPSRRNPGLTSTLCPGGMQGRSLGTSEYRLWCGRAAFSWQDESKLVESDPVHVDCAIEIPDQIQAWTRGTPGFLCAAIGALPFASGGGADT